MPGDYATAEILRRAAVELAEDHTVSLLALDSGWQVMIEPEKGSIVYDNAFGDTIEAAMLDAIRLLTLLRDDGLIQSVDAGV